MSLRLFRTPALKLASPSANDQSEPEHGSLRDTLMTSSLAASSTQLDPAATTSEIVHDAVSCAVCRHELDAHDAISHRYCQATQAHALERSCICRSQN
jgi:hypothetical protein